MCAGQLRVGMIVNLYVTTYKRKAIGPKYQGKMLYMMVRERIVVPERVGNYWVCPKVGLTEVKFVNLTDMCTLLADVDDNKGDVDVMNLVPLCHAFPVSWIHE